MGSAANQKMDEIVLHRDDFTCQMCGATEREVDLTVMMFPPSPDRTAIEAIDLKTLCVDCCEGAKTANFSPRMNADELLCELRRATARDQLVVLEWLQQKHSRQTN